MTEQQKAAIEKQARKECASVLEMAEEYDGFKDRDMEKLIDIVGEDDLDKADDYLFVCIKRIRMELKRK